MDILHPFFTDIANTRKTLYNKEKLRRHLMELFLWQIWCISGVIFFIIEMFTPVLFFFNLGLACFIAAITAYFGIPLIYQVLIFGVFSAIFLIWLRPFLIRKKNGDKPETIEMYVGKTASVIETVDEEKGRISIFGEEWQAKSLNGEVIPKGSYVKIIKNDSIVMYVVPLE